MSDQGGCSCVQDISVTLCEENIMFWEVSGIVTEDYCWTLVEFAMFGILHRVILSRAISFLHCTLLGTLVLCPFLFSVSCFLSFVSDSGS